MSRNPFNMHCLLWAVIALLFFAAFDSSNVLRADSDTPVPSNHFKITGRQYEQNGIIFDVPKVDDPSRDATVVSFPNRAVIPSYIDVGGVQYTVRKNI